jgi:hypothetical protein
MANKNRNQKTEHKVSVILNEKSPITFKGKDNHLFMSTSAGINSVTVGNFTHRSHNGCESLLLVSYPGFLNIDNELQAAIQNLDNILQNRLNDY